MVLSASNSIKFNLHDSNSAVHEIAMSKVFKLNSSAFHGKVAFHIAKFDSIFLSGTYGG